METTTNLKVLEIGEIVQVNKRLYRVGLKKWSNGGSFGYSANLKKVSYKDLVKRFIDTEKAHNVLNEIELKASDLPTDENNLKEIDILKDCKEVKG